MDETEHKIKITTEYEDKAGSGIKQSQAQILSFAKEAEKAGKTLDTNLSGAMKNVNKNAITLSSVFSSLKISTLGVGAVVGGFVAIISKSIKEFVQAEEATKKLTLALKNSGISSIAGVESFKRLATSIQSTTKFSEDAIIALGTFLTQAGVGYKDLDRATLASTEYAAAFGLTVEEAGRQVAASFNGQARELGKFIPEIKNLSEEQLKAGAAADILLQKFGGSASSDRETLTGSIAALMNGFNELAEIIGSFFEPILRKLGETISWYAKQIQTFVNIVNGQLGGDTASEKEVKALKTQTDLQTDKIKNEKNYQKEVEKTNELRTAFEDAKKQIEQEGLTPQGVIAEETNLRMNAIQQWYQANKIGWEQYSQLMNQALKLQENKMDALHNKDLKQAQELADEKINATTSAAQGLTSGSASSTAGTIAGLAGSAGPQAAMIAAAIGIAANLKELPSKISNMLSGLVSGIVEGFPQLLDYLSGPFITDLLTKFIPAMAQFFTKLPAMLTQAVIEGVATLIRELPNMLKGIVTGVFSGIGSSVKGFFSSIGGLFGGGPSPQEKLAQVMEQLKDTIKDLNASLKSTYRDILRSVSSSSSQLRMSRSDFSNLQSQGSRLRREIRSAGREGDTERAAELLSQLAEVQKDQMAKAKEIYDLELAQVTKLYEKKKEVYQRERSILTERLQDLRSLRKTALDAIANARESIISGSLTESQNLERLKSNFSSATTGQQKSDAASALAGGLVSQFESSKRLAASGAISGEQLAAIQSDLLAQLDQTQGEVVSEFSQLISKTKAQIKVLDAGFKKVTDVYKQQTDKLRDVLLDISKKLSNLPQYASGTPYVPQTGLAVLHEGESVIPKAMNRGGIVFNINGVPASGMNKEMLTKAVREILLNNIGNFRGAIQKVG